MSQKTVMAVYDQRHEAEAALKALQERGYRRNEVSLLSHPGEGHEGIAPYQPEPHDAGTGAAAGGLAGGVAGLLLGVGMLTVPGMGPMVVAGPIAATLVGMVTGAVMGGLVGVLMEFGVPETDAHLYTEALRRGATVVAVTAPPERAEAVSELLQHFAPVDLSRRAEEWKGEGWIGGSEPPVDPTSPLAALAPRPPLSP